MGDAGVKVAVTLEETGLEDRGAAKKNGNI
jgi:hypothetical protein